MKYRQLWSWEARSLHKDLQNRDQSPGSPPVQRWVHRICQTLSLPMRPTSQPGHLTGFPKPAPLHRAPTHPSKPCSDCSSPRGPHPHTEVFPPCSPLSSQPGPCTLLSHLCPLEGGGHGQSGSSCSSQCLEQSPGLGVMAACRSLSAAGSLSDLGQPRPSPGFAFPM